MNLPITGLLYLQTVRKDNDKYFGILRRWRSRILERHEEPGPVWLGYRNTTSKDGDGFDVVVYKKGAWVLHMLRIMMLDFKTMDEEQFTAMMRDFYGQYRVKLRVQQENVAEDFQMYVPVTVDLSNGQVARARVKVRGATSEPELPLMPSKPKGLRFNDLDGVLAEVKMVSW